MHAGVARVELILVLTDLKSHAYIAIDIYSMNKTNG